MSCGRTICQKRAALLHAVILSLSLDAVTVTQWFGSTAVAPKLHGKSNIPAIPESLAASPDAQRARGRQFIRRYSFGIRADASRPAGTTKALEGTVVSISPESVFVDIGRKMDGVLPVELFRDAAGALTVQVGDKLRVSITGRDRGRLLHAFHHQSGASQGLERAGAGVRREARHRRRGHGTGEGRIARGCRLAGVSARFAQRREGSGGVGEAGWPGNPVPDHQAGYGQRRRGGGSPRDPGRRRGAGARAEIRRAARKAPWCAAPFAASPISARLSIWAEWTGCCMSATWPGIAWQSRPMW